MSNQTITIGICALILTIVGWVVAYRLGIRSKKKDLIVPIINEIRDSAIKFIGDIFERLEYANKLKNNPPQKGHPYLYRAFSSPPSSDELKKEIELIIIRNSHVLGFFKRKKIRSKVNHISKLAEEIIPLNNWDDNIHDKYRKIFYKHLNSIGVYD